MINSNNVSDILPMLMQDDEVVGQLQNDFPNILADLVTFKENPNCSCRGRVFKFFSEELEKNASVLDKYVKNPSLIAMKLQTLTEERLLSNYAGRIFVIEKGEEAWKAFHSTLTGKMFRMFSVVERDNEVVIYFL